MNHFQQAYIDGKFRYEMTLKKVKFPRNCLKSEDFEIQGEPHLTN